MAGVQALETKLQICITPQTADLTAVQFAALTYIDICCLSEVPELGTETEFLSEHCIDGTELTGIGAKTGMETECSFFYKAGCAGQKFLLDEQGKNISYAIKLTYTDATPTTTPTIIYAKIKIGGYVFGSADKDSFIPHTSSWKISQDPILVAPSAI